MVQAGAWGPWGEPLGLGPEGKPPSRVSGDVKCEGMKGWREGAGGIQGGHGGVDERFSVE